MADREKIIKGIDICLQRFHCGEDCPYYNDAKIWCEEQLREDALALLKEHEPIKPTINEYGEAYCICGENVGIIPNSKNLPKIQLKYCSECGRRMKWDD